jgi:heme-degrading monooxygenase HmoA
MASESSPPARATGSPSGVWSATFIFAKRQFDDDFHRLDQAIAAAAKALPGYLGEEAWENAATGLVSNVYYWSSLEALQQLMSNPAHLQAKAAQGRWLAGYRVVIAQVTRAYGGGELPPGVVAFDLP